MPEGVVEVDNGGTGGVTTGDHEEATGHVETDAHETASQPASSTGGGLMSKFKEMIG